MLARPGGIFFVGGTRPEAIKLAPVIRATRCSGHSVWLVATGQHPQLFDETLSCFGLVPDAHLAAPEAMATGPATMLAHLVPQLARIIERARPAAVVVQGDTTSALAGALAAHYSDVPVIHVEAGLRTGQRDPFPEEMHRRQIGQLASLHFAPTPAAARALHREGIAPETVVMTGNSGIDALLWMAQELDSKPSLSAAIAARFAMLDRRRPLLLATLHRRENRGAPLRSVLGALAELSREAEIVLPVHPHPDVAGPVHAALAGLPGVHLLPPLHYPAFVWLMRQATLAITDSGGVQEEAPALGLPVLVTRHATERPEGLASGNARLLGTGRKAILSAVRGLLAGDGLAAMAAPALPYGAGDASARMASEIRARFQPLKRRACQPHASG